MSLSFFPYSPSFHPPPFSFFYLGARCPIERFAVGFGWVGGWVWVGLGGFGWVVWVGFGWVGGWVSSLLSFSLFFFCFGSRCSVERFAVGGWVGGWVWEGGSGWVGGWISSLPFVRGLSLDESFQEGAGRAVAAWVRWGGWVGGWVRWGGWVGGLGGVGGSNDQVDE